MRYGETENTILLGNFPTSGTVTIKIIDLSDDSLVSLTSNSCVESTNIPGLYKFDVSANMTLPSTYKNYAYEMTDGLNVFRGKFVYGDVQINEAAIAQEVWNATTRTLTATLAASESQVQAIIDAHEADIVSLLGDPTPEQDIADMIRSLDTGLRQVLSNISDEINENEATIVASTGMRISI
jgi:hypothetical protein